MRVFSGVFLLVLACCVASCDGPSSAPSTTPTQTPLPPPANPPPIPHGPMDGERWNLAGTYTGHTGPEACLPPFDGNPREPGNSVLVIQRAGESIDFWTEHDHYVGTVKQGKFFATEIDDAGSTWQCGDRRLRFRYEGEVSGRFSEDGRALTGEEAAVFHLESGDTIRRRWSWNAVRQ